MVREGSGGMEILLYVLTPLASCDTIVLEACLLLVTGVGLGGACTALNVVGGFFKFLLTSSLDSVTLALMRGSSAIAEGNWSLLERS